MSHLKLSTDEHGWWWVYQISYPRIGAPLAIGGPYRTKLEAEVVARARSKGAKAK